MFERMQRAAKKDIQFYEEVEHNPSYDDEAFKVVLLVGVFAGATVSTLISRSITKPILEVVHVAKAISQGDLSNGIDRNGVRVVRWTYASERLVLYFQDQTGFSRYRLTPQSRAECHLNRGMRGSGDTRGLSSPAGAT